MKLIEGLALRRFLVLPRGQRVGWGQPDIDRALAAADAWVDQWLVARCGFDFETVLAAALAEMGASGVSPMSADACVVWQRVLLKGDPKWWPLAARRLYHCGGPPIQLSVFQAESKVNQERREALLRWYRLR
jgi:hypothetical protein